MAIDAYPNMAGRSGCSEKNMIFAYPDGLVFSDPHGACPVGIIEVECPYSLSVLKIECDSEWHQHL